MNFLDLQHVAFAHSKTTILADVSFVVEKGAFICIVGASGGGKTTLLRVIAGLEKISAGALTLEGAVLSSTSLHVPTHKRGISLVFQDYALFPHLTVLKNILFGMQQRDKETARNWLAHVGLQDFAAHYPHQLSGGQQQRVALARALATHPRLLLLDEPFSGLDATLRKELREQTMQLLRQAGTTVLMVTHDPQEALLLADKIMVLEKGRVAHFDTPAVLCCEKKLDFGRYRQMALEP